MASESAEMTASGTGTILVAEPQSLAGSASSPRAPSSWLPKTIGLREIRLASGLVLLTFLVMHFSNHALGLISIDAMESGRRWFNVFWHNPPATILLYGSLFIHFALALLALYQRHSLRMPAREAAQLLLGLSLPFLLIGHVTGTRLGLAITGQDPTYFQLVRNLWINSPELGVQQAVALIIAWSHACFGVYFWLRFRPWFPKVSFALFGLAVVVPMLALLGFSQAGKSLATMEAPPREGEASRPAILSRIQAGFFISFGGLIGLTLLGREARYWATRSTRVQINYLGQRTITVPKGSSVLEASRIGNIQHASACGGRGRCSTCRIRLVDGQPGQPPPSSQERITLARIGADREVRLACQFRPIGWVTVVPLVAPATAAPDTAIATQHAGGREREISVLFCDLRGFTRLTEQLLPFDTVFILNRYFEMVGSCVEQSGGHLDKFVGDGALALFGLDSDPATASRQAVNAVQRIKAGIRAINETYSSELEKPLQLAMSLHSGPAIVGAMGYGSATALTAVGDTLNTASRLEGLAKELNAELVVSDKFASLAGLDSQGGSQSTVDIRGRTERMTVLAFPNADLLQFLQLAETDS